MKSVGTDSHSRALQVFLSTFSSLEFLPLQKLSLFQVTCFIDETVSSISPITIFTHTGHYFKSIYPFFGAELGGRWSRRLVTPGR